MQRLLGSSCHGSSPGRGHSGCTLAKLTQGSKGWATCSPSRVMPRTGVREL